MMGSTGCDLEMPTNGLPRLILISSRKEGMTHDDCIEYLEREHTPLVTELPDLKRVTTSIPRAPDMSGHSLDPDGTRYDVRVELQFESLDALKAAFDSEAGGRVLTDVQQFTNTDERVMIVLTDETLRYHAIPSYI